MYVYVHTYIYMPMFTYVCVCTDMFIHIHTHIYVNKRNQRKSLSSNIGTLSYSTNLIIPNFHRFVFQSEQQQMTKISEKESIIKYWYTF